MKSIVYIVFWAFFCLETYSKPIKIAISSTPNNLNPLFSTDGNSQNIGRLIHISLIDISEDMKIFCMACESFSEETRNDKYIIKFKLRNDLKFHDGEAIDSSSVKRAVEIYQSEEIKSVFRFAFRKIKEVKIFNKYEFELIYEKFELDNLPNLVLLKILKMKDEEVIGAGEYKLAEQDDFNVNLKSLTGRPDLDFKVVKDETTLALKLMKREIDLSVVEMSPRKIEWLRKNSNEIKIHETTGSNYRYINFNHQNYILKNRKVRKALAHLVPRDDILKHKLKGYAISSSGFMSKAFSDYYIESSGVNYDPKLAEKLLDEAGLVLKDGKRFSLTWISTNNRSILEVINFIKESFESVGISVDLITQEWGTFMKNVKSGAFDIYTSQWIGFTGPDILNFVFMSDKVPPNGANRGYYINKKLDQVLNDASTSIDKQKRIDLYKSAINIVSNDFAYIDLWHPSVIWPSRKCINLPKLFPTGSFVAFMEIEDNCTD